MKELDIVNVGCVESLKTFKKENSAMRVYFRRSRSNMGLVEWIASGRSARKR